MSTNKYQTQLNSTALLHLFNPTNFGRAQIQRTRGIETMPRQVAQIGLTRFSKRERLEFISGRSERQKQPG